nr:ionotropic receptor 21a-like [Procambarus clarkii]
MTLRPKTAQVLSAACALLLLFILTRPACALYARPALLAAPNTPVPAARPSTLPSTIPSSLSSFQAEERLTVSLRTLFHATNADSERWSVLRTPLHATNVAPKDPVATKVHSDNELPTNSLHDEEQPTKGLHDEEQPTKGLHDEEQRTKGLHDEEQPTKDLHDEEQPTKDLHDEEQPTEDLHDEEQPTKAFPQKAADDRFWGRALEVASLLTAVKGQQLGRCALAITTDLLHLPAVQLFLQHNEVGSGGSEEEQVCPVTVFTLPPPSQMGGIVNHRNLDYMSDHCVSQEDGGPLLASQYLRVGQETCTHYLFLVTDPHRLLQLLDALHQDSLDLHAKFVLVTHLRPDGVLAFLQASPINKIPNVLLVTSSAAGGQVALTLYTHLFFLAQQRISLTNLGTWPRGWNLGTWPHGRNFGGVQWFPRKLAHFHGFTFRATTFDYRPFTILERGPGGRATYDGLEIRLLQTLASALNFTLEIHQPADGEKWGSRLANGSWTGAVGETVRGETEVSFANYFITADRLKIMDMTRPYNIDYTCFVTPKPRPGDAQYTAVTSPFQASVWCALVGMMAAVPPVVRLAGVLEPGTWFLRLDNAVWYAVGLFLTQAQPCQLVPVSSGLRVVVVTSWVAATVISSVYKSALIAFLMVPLPAAPVDTLEQLLHSGLRWGVRDTGGWEEWFSSSIDPISRKVAAGFQYVKGIEEGVARVLDGSFAFMNSGTFLRYLVASNFTDAFGETKLHVARECFVPFRVGLGMPRFSVYTPRFNVVVARVVEAGLVHQWLRDLLDQEHQGKNRL